MGLFANINPPNLALAPKEYSQEYINKLNNTLRLFFNNIDSVQPISIASLNINISTFPTEADVATLRSGDVYRDTTAGNVLKVKV
jgi:hypothetical protein